MPTTIERYPRTSEIAMAMRDELHPRFAALPDGISEFTFAGIYLFREVHDYRIASLDDGVVVITGRDGDDDFFMLPFGLPDAASLRDLFAKHGSMKAVSESQAEILSGMGYSLVPDRDNFDYLYSRKDLVALAGRRFHKKKNLLSAFIRNNECEARPLLEEYRDDAIEVLEAWRSRNGPTGDYFAAREALEKMEALQQCGGVFYVENRPVSYCLGEELALGTSYVIHFEKAVTETRYKGIYQYTNRAFAAVLPDKYVTINREQDLGDPGLRQAKETYQPIGFVRKYRAKAAVPAARRVTVSRESA